MQYPSDPNLKLYEPEYERRFGSTPPGTFVVGGRSKNPVQQAKPPEPTQADRDAFYVNSNDTFVQTRMGGSIVPPEFGPEKPVPPDVMKDILEKMGDRYDPMSNEKFSDQWQRLGITDPLKNQNLQDIAQGIYNSQLLKERYDAGQRGLNLFDPGYEKRFGSTPPGAFVVGGSSWERTPEELKAEYEQNVRNTAMSGANLLQDLASYSPTGQSGYGDFYTRAQADPSLLRKFHGESDEDALMRLKYNVMDAEQRQGRRQALRSEMGSGNDFVVSGQPYGNLEPANYGGVGLMGALENMRRIQAQNPQYQNIQQVASAITGTPTAGALTQVAPSQGTAGQVSADTGLTPKTAAADDWMKGSWYNTATTPTNFDWQKYIAANQDLAAAGIDTAEEAARHYDLYGRQEGRNLGLGKPTDFSQLTSQDANDAVRAFLAANPGRVGQFLGPDEHQIIRDWVNKNYLPQAELTGDYNKPIFAETDLFRNTTVTNRPPQQLASIREFWEKNKDDPFAVAKAMTENKVSLGDLSQATGETFQNLQQWVQNGAQLAMVGYDLKKPGSYDKYKKSMTVQTPEQLMSGPTVAGPLGSMDDLRRSYEAMTARAPNTFDYEAYKKSLGAPAAPTSGALTQASTGTTGATDTAAKNLGTIRDYEGKEYDASTIINLAKQIAPLIDTKTSSGGAFGTKGESIGFNYDEIKRILGKDVSPAQQIILDMARSLMSQGVTDISQLTSREYEEPGAAIDEGGTQFAPGAKRMGVFAGETMLPEQFGRTFTGKGATGYNVRIDPQTGKPVFSTSGYSTSDRGAIAPLLMMANLALPGVGTALSGGLASLAPGALAAGSLANQALTNAIISGSMSKLSGGDFGKGFIRGGLTPVVGAGVGNMIPADFAAANPQLANAIRGVGAGAITAGLTGGDFKQALTSGITNAAINASMNAALGQIPGYTDLSPSAKAAVNQIVGTAIRGGKQDPIRIAMAAINAQMAADAEKARKAKKPGGLASGGAVPGYYDGGDVDFGDYGEYEDWWAPVDFGSDEYNWWDPIDLTPLENVTIVDDRPETVIDPTVFPDFLIPQEEEEPSVIPFADLEEEYRAYGPIESDVPEETFVPPDLSECRAGEVRDEDGNCVNVASRDPCPPGTHVDEEGECVADPEPEDPTQCPEGYLYNFNTQSCEKISDTPPPTPPRPPPPPPPPPPPRPPTGGGLSMAGGSQTNVSIPPVQQLAPLILEALKTQGGSGGYQDPLARLKEIVSGMRPTSAPTYKMDPYLESLVNQSGRDSYFTYGKEPSMEDVLNMSRGFADGGEVEAFSHLAAPLMAGGGSHMAGREDFRDGKHVSGPGDGQSDDIPAWLADGEFVFPADVVAALGNGSTKAGTDKLYDMMHNIRKYHRSADPEDLPPEAKKSPLDYLSKGKKGAKA